MILQFAAMTAMRRNLSLQSQIRHPLPSGAMRIIPVVHAIQEAFQKRTFMKRPFRPFHWTGEEDTNSVFTGVEVNDAADESYGAHGRKL